VADETKSTKRSKKTETLRERTARANKETEPKARRIRKTASAVGKPLRAAHRVGKKTYYLPMPNNKFGRIMNKHIRLFPRFFIDAWRELRQVQWPTGKQTMRLSWAVFIFSLVFGALIAVVDFGLDKLFKYVFIK
jgi:preprotein translocase SecE subunit